MTILLSDELVLRSLIDRWSAAVRNHDLAAIRADHDPDILMFDVPAAGPLFSRGIDAYMSTWDLFFSCAGKSLDKTIAFNFSDIEITAGDHVAFATAIGHCADIHPDGRRIQLDFRLTMGFRKIDGHWRITHEHHSVPAN